MSDTITLAPADAAVLSRIPTVWFDENVCGAEIAMVLHKTTGDTMRRIARLVTLGLVRRRHAGNGTAQSDIRRVRR